MKKLAIFIALSFFACANNIKVVTANDVASFYANYRNHQERLIESKIIRPRLSNFAKELFLETLKSKEKKKEIPVAYSAVLAILTHKGERFILPSGYESLYGNITKEIDLIVNANQRAISPTVGVWVDYTLFKIPPQYEKVADYFRAMKFAQTMPFMINPSTITKVNRKQSDRLLKSALVLKNVIGSSQRLTNLYRAVNDNLNSFIGRADDFSLNDIEDNRGYYELRAILNRNPKCPVDSDIPFLLDRLNRKKRCRVSLSIRLFPPRYTIDNYILANSPKSQRDIVSKHRFNEIIKAISPTKKIPSLFDDHPKLLTQVHKEIQNALIVQKSSYDYDLKIMKTLIDANHIEAFKTYYKMVQTRAYLYKKRTDL